LPIWMEVSFAPSGDEATSCTSELPVAEVLPST
jgi:hypothetical protein